MKIVVLFLVAALSGCGTIVNGTTQKVPISSSPDGAKVTTGEQTTTTPGALELKRKTPHTLTVSKEGYETETVRLESVLSGAVTGNILLGGLVGWGVDAASGGDSKLIPESINVTLRPLAKAEANPPAADPAGPLKATADQLAEAERLYQDGKVSEKEYKKLRERIIGGQ